MAEITKDMVSDVFGDEKAAKVIELLQVQKDSVLSAAEERVARALDGRGVAAPKALRPHDKRYRIAKDVFDHNGTNRFDGSQWTISTFKSIDNELHDKFVRGEIKPDDVRDLVTMNEQPYMFPRILAERVTEALEPELVLTPLLQEIRYTHGPIMVFPAFGPMSPGNLEVGEATEYKEGKTQWSGTISVTIGKHGLKVAMTDEAIQFSLFDLWGIHLRQAGRALARWKEKQVADKVLGSGSIFIDNGDGSARHTSGRGSDGELNGTFTYWDLIEMCSDLMREGYIADTVIVHPFAWPIFAYDPYMRAMGFMLGGQMVKGPQGSVGTNGQLDPGGLNTNRQLSDPANRATTWSPVPSQFPFAPLRVITSPMIEFDSTAMTTTVYVCDSKDLGVLVTHQPVTTEEWRVPEFDYRNIKFMERYGVASMNKGRAIRRALKVVVARGYAFEGGMLSADVTLGTSFTPIA